MDAKAKIPISLATLLLLTLLVNAFLPPKCFDSCVPMGVECKCGSSTCSGVQSCGYASIDGTKQCYDDAQVNNGECNIRAWVIAGRILCIMLLLAPYIAFLMIVLGSVFIIFGGDNPSQKTTGKKWIKNAIIGGLIVIALVQFSKAYLNLNLSYSICQSLGGP
jgi:hypothetical protein